MLSTPGTCTSALFSLLAGSMIANSVNGALSPVVFHRPSEAAIFMGCFSIRCWAWLWPTTAVSTLDTSATIMASWKVGLNRCTSCLRTSLYALMPAMKKAPVERAPKTTWGNSTHSCGLASSAKKSTISARPFWIA
ncbi:hypothetical protein D3C75_913530 [compost metagenome]